jgi:hypothetical protein
MNGGNASLGLDEHQEDFCFLVGIALRRILELEPPEEDKEEDTDEWHELLDTIRDKT